MALAVRFFLYKNGTCDSFNVNALAGSQEKRQAINNELKVHEFAKAGG